MKGREDSVADAEEPFHGAHYARCGPSLLLDRKTCAGRGLIGGKTQPLHRGSRKLTVLRGPSTCKQTAIKDSITPEGSVLSNSPVTDCGSCSLGVASQGRCRLTPTSRESGATICAQGERPRTVYFIKEGFVALSAVSPRGSELLLSLRGPASLLCTEAMQGEPSPFEVRALSRVKICGISGDALSQWVGPDKSAARVVLDLLLTESRQQRDEVNWRQGDCLSRVARFPCHLPPCHLVSRCLRPRSGPL